MTIPTAAPAEAPKLKFSYFTVLPTIVRLRTEDIVPHLPANAWIGNADGIHREITLSAAEILETNYPRIRFTRLKELLPGCLADIEGAPEWIGLPAGLVALAYKPETQREPVEAPSENLPVISKSVADTPPNTEEPKDILPPIPAWKRLLKPILAPPRPPSPQLKEQMTFASSPISSELEPRLRELFKVEGILTIQRLAELSATLPGIEGCVLQRGKEVIRFGNLPADFNAKTFGGQIRDFCEKIDSSTGLKLKPAITLYLESGLISLLQYEESLLAVSHDESGLSREVRQRLEAVLEAVQRTIPPAN